MRIYVASKFSRLKDVQLVQKVLQEHGHTIVGDWTKHTLANTGGKAFLEGCRAFAEADREGVRQADALVMLHDAASRGGFVELGMALAWGKLVVVLGGRTQYPHRAPIFYALPEVVHFETAEEAADWLEWAERGFADLSDSDIEKVSA